MTGQQKARIEYNLAKTAARDATRQVNEAQGAYDKAKRLLTVAQDNQWDANVRLRQARDMAVEVGV